MVLPAPPAHDAPDQGAFLGAIRRELSLTSKGLIVLVDRARPGALRGLVRGLLPTYPDLDVHTDVTDVYSVPEGSVMVLAPRPENADWLNVQRPVFARRALKVILWCHERTTKALARNAVDFFDWISHRHECPDVPPLHGVLGIRTALCARAPGIVWTGGDLEACFQAALPGREMVHLSAKRPVQELVEAVRAAGRAWIVWDDMEHFFHQVLVMQVQLDAGRRSRLIINSKNQHFHWPRIHGLCLSLRAARTALANAKAPGRLAALAGLEPEAITLIKLALQTGNDERIIERIVSDAEDPGAAIVQNVGMERSLKLPQVSRSRKLPDKAPPILRAFRDETFLANEWGREAWKRAQRSPKGMAWNALLIATEAAPQGELDQAEALARWAIDLTAQVLGPESGEHADALRALATVMHRRGRFGDAEELLRRALDLRDLTPDRHRSLMILMLVELTNALTHQGRYAEAEDVAERARNVVLSGVQAGNLTSGEATMLLSQIPSPSPRGSGGGAVPE